MEKIAQGAEAVIYRDEDVLIKQRIKKGYRISQLDSFIRRKRTRSEAALLREARRAGVLTPQIVEEAEDSLRMEFIEGIKVKDALNESNLEGMARKIGESIAKLHKFNIVHGDLTTSNMLLKDGEVYFVDFGLGFQSGRPEDKATDLYLLNHALEAAHWQIFEKMWKLVLAAYKKNYDGAEKVMKSLADIERRGRYRQRTAVG